MLAGLGEPGFLDLVHANDHAAFKTAWATLTFDFKKKKAEKLKNITVAPKIKYEKKGSDPIRVNNYVNTVMTTNNDFTIPISQTDRRNVFFKCSDKHIRGG